MSNILNTFKNIAFISLGSNLDNPTNQILSAIDKINKNNSIIIIKQSSLYLSKAYGYTNQNNFVNAVIKIKTNLDCELLLKQLQNIEQVQKRVRTIHWGPRTIDLDILAFNNLKIETKNLTIPHYDLKNRKFVLAPWNEIDPRWQLPDGSIIKNLFSNLK